jgi:ribonuclease E
VRMLQGNGFREIKVAKRSKDGPLMTARKREGSVELRFAVRVSRGGQPVDRRAVQELRKDLGHYAAQVGLMVSAQDLRGDARGEATSSGALVMLWCGDALGEKFLDAEAGVTISRVEIYEIDERFFELARIDAVESQRRREERQRERQEQGGSPPGEPAEAAQPGAEAPAPGAEGAPMAAEGAPPAPADEGPEGADDIEGEEGEDDDELEAAASFAASPNPQAGGPGGAPGAPGTPGGGRRRRRRRRGRRGRGPRPEGAAPAPGGADAGAPRADAGPAAGAPPPPPPPSSSDGGSQAG